MHFNHQVREREKLPCFFPLTKKMLDFALKVRKSWGVFGMTGEYFPQKINGLAI